MNERATADHGPDGVEGPDYRPLFRAALRAGLAVSATRFVAIYVFARSSDVRVEFHRVYGVLPSWLLHTDMATFRQVQSWSLLVTSIVAAIWFVRATIAAGGHWMRASGAILAPFTAAECLLVDVHLLGLGADPSVVGPVRWSAALVGACTVVAVAATVERHRRFPEAYRPSPVG